MGVGLGVGVLGGGCSLRVVLSAECCERREKREGRGDNEKQEKR